MPLLDMSCCATGSLTPVRDSRRYECLSVISFVQVGEQASLLPSGCDATAAAEGAHQPVVAPQDDHGLHALPAGLQYDAEVAHALENTAETGGYVMRRAREWHPETPPTSEGLTGHFLAEKARTPD